MEPIQLQFVSNGINYIANAILFIHGEEFVFQIMNILPRNPDYHDGFNLYGNAILNAANNNVINPNFVNAFHGDVATAIFLKLRR